MRKMFTVLMIMCLAIAGLGVSVMAADIKDFRIPGGFYFMRDLYKGKTTAPDVSYLQNLLNMSTSTQVAATGAGSNKQLTSFYGDKTQSAVGNFQALFANDIAFEKSLSTSTAPITSGVVDQFTRSVLNKLIIVYTDTRNYTGTSTATSTNGVYKKATSSDIITIPGLQDKPEAFIYKSEKNLFALSPQGLLLRAIGGSALVDKVYSYTPGGKVGEKLGVAGAAGGAAGGAMGGGLGGGMSGGGVITPFGGESIAMTNCTCSSNILLTIKDVNSGSSLSLIYQPGVTRLYREYRPTTGVNMLGNYTAGGTCLIYAGTSCTSGGSPQGTMTVVGTSLSI